MLDRYLVWDNFGSYFTFSQEQISSLEVVKDVVKDKAKDEEKDKEKDEEKYELKDPV